MACTVPVCPAFAYLIAGERGALWASVRVAVPQPGGTTVAWLDGAAGERERKAGRLHGTVLGGNTGIYTFVNMALLLNMLAICQMRLVKSLPQACCSQARLASVSC